MAFAYQWTKVPSIQPLLRNLVLENLQVNSGLEISPRMSFHNLETAHLFLAKDEGNIEQHILFLPNLRQVTENWVKRHPTLHVLQFKAKRQSDLQVLLLLASPCCCPEWWRPWSSECALNLDSQGQSILGEQSFKELRKGLTSYLSNDGFHRFKPDLKRI